MSSCSHNRSASTRGSRGVARAVGYRRLRPATRHAARATGSVRRLYRNLTFQVLVAIFIGVVLGIVAPDTAKAMRPVGDTFIKLVKMVIGPIIFLTIVLGIGNMADLKKVGKVGGKALLYFEVVTTFALAIGLAVVNITRPGAGLAAASVAGGDASALAAQGRSLGFVGFLTHTVPATPFPAFAEGD